MPRERGGDECVKRSSIMAADIRPRYRARQLARMRQNVTGVHIIVSKGTRRQQHRRPDESRGEIGDLERPPRHFENAGGQRHRGAQRPEEPADENRSDALFRDKRVPARKRSGIARQRPHPADRGFKRLAQPIGEPVAQRRADAAAIQIGTKLSAPAPISAPMATSTVEAGNSSEMKASDSQNASPQPIAVPGLLCARSRCITSIY